jgi:hypothetical protein
MTQFLMIIRNIFQKTNFKPPLGRWNIETCDKKLNNKIDLANQDHCGPCGKYIRIVKFNESVKSVHSNNILRIDDISNKNSSRLSVINQPTNVQLYLPTYLPTYLPAYQPTNLHIHRKILSKLDK